ncbi:MAG TPA: ABC transporter ATP-binding protein [Acidimicrobiia bacterium]|nr:ABC transporter ATP-binding protein [Acidimicrobiia bacterium]
MPRWRPPSRFDPSELERGIDRATLRRAWAFARPYRGLLALQLSGLAATAVIGILPALVLKALIDRAVAQHLSSGGVNVLVAAAVGIALTMTGLGLLNRWLGSRIGEGLIYDLRVALFSHVQQMPVAFFTYTQTGSLLSRMGNDVLDAQQAVGTLSTVVSDLFTLITTLTAMLLLSWQATVLALLVVPGFVVLDRKMAKRLATLSRQRMTANAHMTSTMAERLNVAGALLVKLFGRPRQEADEFSERAAVVREAGIKLAVQSRLYYGSLALVGAVGTAAVYWVGGRGLITGSMKVGTLTALAAYVSKLYSPLTDLASARVDLLTALVSFERVFEVLDAPAAVADVPGATPLPRPVAGRLDVDDVWFRYPSPATVSIESLEGEGVRERRDQPSEPVLRGVSFSAEPGSMVALVGPSGAGKTTLSSLIPRLYDVTSGAVRIDGHDVRDLTLESVSRAVGVVSQDPHLFHDTVAANLRYARPGAGDDEVVAACRAARIHDVIAALPDGYDTVVGERGYRLSGGEKQRLSIARLLLKAPAVVVLDEATSHLDSENEALIQQALSVALAGRTAVVIAHRLSTIAAADQILVLDGGRIVERGRHAELLRAGGLYAELFETQFKAAAAG